MATIIDAGLKFVRDFDTNTPEYIIVHHALASHCTIQDVHSWHLQNGWTGCGYHYFIAKDGKIYKGRPDNANGAHTEEQYMNYRSIGICLEGCYEHYVPNPKKPEYVMEDFEVPPEQFSALADLIKGLQATYNIPNDNVKPHRFFATYKLCPGNHFPWDKLVAELEKPKIHPTVQFFFDKGALTDKVGWTVNYNTMPGLAEWMEATRKNWSVLRSIPFTEYIFMNISRKLKT